jgi:hypothetical protein
MTIGMPESSRSLRAISMPSSPGRRRSSTTRSIVSRAMTSRISRPFASAVTRMSLSPR